MDSFDHPIESVRGIKEVSFDHVEKQALKSNGRSIFISNDGVARDIQKRHESVVESGRRNYENLNQQATATFFGTKLKRESSSL